MSYKCQRNCLSCCKTLRGSFFSQNLITLKPGIISIDIRFTFVLFKWTLFDLCYIKEIWKRKRKQDLSRKSQRQRSKRGSKINFKKRKQKCMKFFKFCIKIFPFSLLLHSNLKLAVGQPKQLKKVNLNILWRTWSDIFGSNYFNKPNDFLDTRWWNTTICVFLQS